MLAKYVTTVRIALSTKKGTFNLKKTPEDDRCDGSSTEIGRSNANKRKANTKPPSISLLRVHLIGIHPRAVDAVLEMDISLNASASSWDRPPSRPVRSMSRSMHIPFTRSRVFQSIYVVQQSRNHHNSRIWNSRWWVVRAVWVSAVMILLTVYFGNTVRLLSAADIEQLSVDAPIQQRKMAMTTIKLNQIGIGQNPRTRGLLEILASAQENDAVPWPSFLTLHKPSTSNPASNVSSCIVTAYFRVKSKHHSSDYDDWMKNMLSMQDCMVIFCEADMVETIQKYRGNRVTTAVISVKLEDLPISNYYYPTATEITPTAFWEHQLEIDREKKIHHSYRVFWIWLSKSWCVTAAALLQHHMFALDQTIEVWMWADIGSFRDHVYNDKQLIQYPHQVIPDTSTVLWMAHRAPNPPASPFWNRKLFKAEKQHFYQSGSHAVAASVAAWTTFHAEFVDTLDQYSVKGLFIGEDQCVIQTTCLLYPESCAYIPFDQVPDNRYFGLRHALHNGPNGGSKRNITTKLKPFHLWRPPTRTTATVVATKNDEKSYW
jgi:hypothetical protein